MHGTFPFVRARNTISGSAETRPRAGGKNCVPESCRWTAKPRNATAVPSLFGKLFFIVTGPQGTLEGSLGLDKLLGRTVLRIRRASNSAKMENPGNSPLTRSSNGLPGHPAPSDRVIRVDDPGSRTGPVIPSGIPRVLKIRILSSSLFATKFFRQIVSINLATKSRVSSM